MKCSFGISDFLEESPSLSHSVVFLYFFALITEEGFLISPYYSLELCIQLFISFLFSFDFCFWRPKTDEKKMWGGEREKKERRLLVSQLFQSVMPVSFWATWTKTFMFCKSYLTQVPVPPHKPQLIAAAMCVQWEPTSFHALPCPQPIGEGNLHTGFLLSLAKSRQHKLWWPCSNLLTWPLLNLIMGEVSDSGRWEQGRVLRGPAFCIIFQHSFHPIYQTALASVNQSDWFISPYVLWSHLLLMSLGLCLPPGSDMLSPGWFVSQSLS